MNGYRVHAAKAQASHTVATGRTGPVALDAKQLRELVIRPALMEIELWSEAAEELVLGTAIVESNYPSSSSSALVRPWAFGKSSRSRGA